MKINPVLDVPVIFSGDTLAPSCVLTSAASDPVYAAFSVTATFSEDVTGFAVGDITVTNGSASNFAGSGAVYTFDVTPTDPGTVSIDIAAGVCTDGAGNPNTASNTLERDYFEYALDVVFADYADNAGPLSSPIVGRVGSIALVDSGSNMSINSGQLIMPAGPVAYDPGFDDALDRTRAAGLVFYFSLENISGGIYGVGVSGGDLARNNSDAWIEPDTQANFNHNSYGLNFSSPTEVVLALRNKGVVYINQDDQIVWIDADSDDTTLRAIASCYSGAMKINTVRTADLVANNYAVFGTRDLDLCAPGTGTGTSSISAPASGNTFVHTADNIINVTLASVPVGTSSIYFRYADASHNLRAYVTGGGGSIILSQDTGAGPSIMGSYAASFAGGEVIDILSNDTTIKIFIDGVVRINVESSLSLAANTAGNISANGGVFSNLTADTLDGVANLTSSNHPGYGLATAVLPGPRAAADTFTHEADCVIVLDHVALSSSGNVNVIFREQDSNNGWYITISTSGDFQLREKISGGFFSRANAAGVLSGGERITIICNDVVIKGYYDNTLAWTYSSAANFKTETSGEINTLGTGGQISNLVAYPLDFAAAPNTGGAAEAAAALALLGA